jgi:hypothetical protein
MKDELKELCEKLKPVIGERADALWLSWLMGDRKDKEQTEGIIQLLYARCFAQKVDTKKALLVPPPQDIARGEYELGNVVYDNKELYPFGIKDDIIWTQHAFIGGRTGAGKTNLLYKILMEFLRKDIPFWVLDWKRDYRPLIANVKDKEVLVFSVGRHISPLTFNPLFPPSGTESEIMGYLDKIIDVIAWAFYVGHGVKSLLKKGFAKIVSNWKEGKGELSFRALLKWLYDYHPGSHEGGRRAVDWKESTVRALEQLCTGEFGLALNTQKPLSMDDLLKKNVIFELDGLSHDQKVFFIETLLLWVREQRIASLNTDAKDQLKNVLVIEEAHNILKTGREEAQKETILEVALRETRSLSMGIILIDQTPSLINQVAFANTYTSIFFSLKGRANITAAAGALLLSKEDSEILGRLPVGTAVVKLQDKWFDPFLIHVPLMPIKKTIISDQDVISHMKDSEGYSGSSEPINPENKRIEGIPESGIEEPKLQEKEIEFTLDIINNQFSGVTARYKRLGLSTRHGNEIKDYLLKQSLVQMTEIKSKEGWIRLLELTLKGFTKLQEQGINVEYSKLHNGMLHRYWKHRVGEYFKKQGYQIAYEKPIDGTGSKRVDVEAAKLGERIAIEIETGRSHSTSDITPLLPLYDKIIIFATNGTAEQKIVREKLTANEKVVVWKQLD